MQIEEGLISPLDSKLSSHPWVDAEDKQGRTALLRALLARDEAKAGRLLDQSARCDLPDRLGHCALGTAKRLGLDGDLIKRLKRHDFGVSKEVFSRRVLAQRLGIEGTSTLAGRPVRLEAMYPSEAHRINLGSALDFYGQLSQDWATNGDLKQRVFERLSPQLAAKVRRVNTEVFQRIFHSVPEALRVARQSRNWTSMERQSYLKTNRPLIVYGSWDKHLTTTVFCQDRVYRCNQGQRADSFRSGIYRNQIKHLHRIPEAIHRLGGSASQYFHKDIYKDLSLGPDEHMRLKAQKIGNCCIKSTYAAEGAVLWDAFTGLLAVEEAKEIAHVIKKVRAEWTAVRSLSDYLAMHQSKQEDCPVAWDILSKVLAAGDSDKEKHRLNADRVCIWAKKHRAHHEAKDLAQMTLARAGEAASPEWAHWIRKRLGCKLAVPHLIKGLDKVLHFLGENASSSS